MKEGGSEGGGGVKGGGSEGGGGVIGGGSEGKREQQIKSKLHTNTVQFSRVILRASDFPTVETNNYNNGIFNMTTTISYDNHMTNLELCRRDVSLASLSFSCQHSLCECVISDARVGAWSLSC